MKVHSLSLCGLATLDMHALNNEGAEGNALMTRMVEIVAPDPTDGGKIKNYTVNAVSGDMLKHIQAEHLFKWSQETGLKLCGGCKSFDANRICADETFTKFPEFTKETLDSVILGKAIQTCTLDDAEGILITSDIGKKRSIARKSCVEFGWMVGRPDTTRTESYFHAKYVPEGRGKGSGAGENLGQNIFHRPASSGQYAAVASIDLYKVGRNDITLDYAIGDEERLLRVKGLLVSVMNTFVRMNGAHRNTQLPHLVDFEGTVVLSTSSLPAPSVSALNPAFNEQIAGLCENMKKVNPKATLEARRFHNLAEFSAVFADVIEQVLVIDRKG
ncbi:MAG: DevR family CRISPR-associated autoregulator [Planctomycetaceae bacterium]|nr:DevR family CRISPR-associated autoregulator [Planctomycetaceae bacterium]